MLASGLAYAQAPGERSEPKRTEEPAKGAAPERGAAQERVQERAQGVQERLQGAGREEKGGAAKQEANDDKRQPAGSAERNQPKAKDQAQESREPSRDRNREADTTKQGRETGKSSAETKQDKSAPQKSTAESEKSKTGTAGQQNERAGAAANQKEQNQSPRDAAEQKNNRPATATDTNRTAPTNNAQTAPSGTQTNQANQTTRTDTQVGQQTSVTTEKQVRISETVSRARLAQPERNLNISIRVGETIPPRVRLYRVPPEIISIEPEYRDYEYFTTDDDVVIVEPRTHRIVSQVPRDPSRARAQMSGSATSSVAAAGSTTSNSLNCRIMRRDASGNVAEAEPTTVGSTGRTDSLSVTVQMPDGSSSAPIALGAPAGNIVVATQGQGDCTVTIEPQTR
jgi:chemotaxis protein histidine kinase CheA